MTEHGANGDRPGAAGGSDMSDGPLARLRLGLDVPGLWTVVEVADAVVVSHPDVEGFFRPNLVVRRTLDHRSLPEISAAALKTALLTLENCHVFANEPMILNGHPARAQRFVCDAGGYSLVVDRWLTTDGVSAIELTASYSVVQSLDMTLAMSNIAASLRVEPSEETEAGASPAERSPRLDDFAGGVAGQPLETLDRFSSGQHYVSEGPVLSLSTINFLTERSGERRVGRLEWKRYANEVDELRRSGLMDSSGRFSGELLSYLIPVRTCRFTLQCAGEQPGEGSHLTLWVGDGAVLVAAGSSHAALVFGNPEGRVPEGYARLDLVGMEGVPGVVASWAGVAPAYSVPARSPEVHGEALNRRMEGKTPVPRDDAALRRMWDQPWFRWSWRIEPLGAGADLLNAAAAGHYLPVVVADGAVALGALKSGDLWDGLVHTYVSALAELPPREASGEAHRGGNQRGRD